MRCFVALWPAAATRAALASVTTGLVASHPAARPMRPANLHLTLAFIGELDAPMATAVAAALDKIAVQPFVWQIDRLGHFAHPRVVWAGGPPAPLLEALAQTVREQLDQLRVDYDLKRFAAHVSLLRNAPRLLAPSELEPIAWPASRPQLIVSSRDDAGALVYRPWPSLPQH